MNSRAKLINIILLIAMILENLCLHILYKQGILTQGKNAILLFVSSLVFGFAFLYKNFGARAAVDEQPAAHRFPVWLAPALLGVAMIGMAFPYAAFLASKPLGPEISDVIPLIQVACRRLLAGEYPYSVVTEFGWEENVAYLPCTGCR